MVWRFINASQLHCLVFYFIREIQFSWMRIFALALQHIHIIRLFVCISLYTWTYRTHSISCMRVLMLQAPCRMNGQRASTDAQCWLSRNFFNQNKHDEPQFWNRERLNGCGCARSEILPFRLGAITSCLDLGMIWKDKRLNCLTFLYANSSFCNFCRSAKGGWPFPRINFHILSNEYPQLSLCKEDKKWENQWLDIELNARMLASLQ